jgi:hypothetical protein
MKRILTATGCCAIVLTAFSLFAEGASNPPVSTRPTPCADPAVDIQAVLVSRAGPDTGRVRITGQIKNLGPEPWIAATHQHRLRMELVMIAAPAHPNGELAEPPIDIVRLDAGGQYRIDHQLDWRVSKDATYPRFLIRFTEVGKPVQPPSRADCRSDNNRKEIASADINYLFSAPPASAIPLKIVSYRLLGGEGINTVESILTYSRNSPAAGKITASVAAPYSGFSEEVSIAGNSGTAPLRVHIPCDRNPASGLPVPPVMITYRLWGLISVSGVPSWVAGFSAEQSIPYRTLCPTKPGMGTSNEKHSP